MGKIKLNLTSGAEVVKPLINAFQANNNSYVVLDNEMNGSMGLPIILVCKLVDNKLTKIMDQNEWQIVKEYLKNIIAGSKVEFIKVPNEIGADDIYYTQLTLPVPSFDALKKAYTILDSEDNGSSVQPETNETEVVSPEIPVNESINNEPINPSVNEAPAAPEINLQPDVEINNPVNIEMPSAPVVEPVVSEPVIEPSITPVASDANVIDTPVVENVPNTVIDLEAPVPTFGAGEENVKPTQVDSISEQQNTEIEKSEDPVHNIFNEQKEAFMQACENMFDALVQRFERELQDRK